MAHLAPRPLSVTVVMNTEPSENLFRTKTAEVTVFVNRTPAAVCRFTRAADGAFLSFSVEAGHLDGVCRRDAEIICRRMSL